MLRQSKDREKMGNCMVLDVTAIFFWITAFLKKLPFLAKGLRHTLTSIAPGIISSTFCLFQEYWLTL